jgi:hypothetical protein
MKPGVYFNASKQINNFMKTILFYILTIFVTDTVYSQGNPIDTILFNNKTKFHIQTKELNNDQVLLIISRNSKVIIFDTLLNALTIPEFPDFNKDRNHDIMLSYFGNNPTYILYLFDPKNNTFKKVEDYAKFPDGIQLKSNSKFYYSYHRAGCADYNWVSDLFIIENFKAIHKGHIYGQGCNFEVKLYPQQIEISKIIKNNSENKKPIVILPYLKHIHQFDEKWDFIERYWNKYYWKFK